MTDSRTTSLLPSKLADIFMLVGVQNYYNLSNPYLCISSHVSVPYFLIASSYVVKSLPTLTLRSTITTRWSFFRIQVLPLQTAFNSSSPSAINLQPYLHQSFTFTLPPYQTATQLYKIITVTSPFHSALYNT